MSIEELPLNDKEKIAAKRLLNVNSVHKALKDFLSKFSKAMNENDRFEKKIAMKEHTNSISKKLAADFKAMKKTMEKTKMVG